MSFRFRIDCGNCGAEYVVDSERDAEFVVTPDGVGDAVVLRCPVCRSSEVDAVRRTD